MSPATAAQLLASGAQDMVAIRLRSIPELGVGISVIDLPGTEFYGYPPVFWRVDSDKIWTGSFYVGELEDSGEDSSRPDLDATLPAALLAAGFSGIQSLCGNGESFSPEGDVETAAQILRGLGYKVSGCRKNGYPLDTSANFPRWTKSDWEEAYHAPFGVPSPLSDDAGADMVPEFNLRPSDDESGTIVRVAQPYAAFDYEVGVLIGADTILWRADSRDSSAAGHRIAWAGVLFDSADVHPRSGDLVAALEFSGLCPGSMVSNNHEAYSPNPDLKGCAKVLRELGYRVTISPATTLRGDDFS